eukprot:11926870-Ditylum_brightwellii.AAC.1
MQNGRIIAYWSTKLTKSQCNYTAMEKELLSIVMCFKEFWSMLLGTHITVFTDHKNLTFHTLNVQRVLRWHLFLKEFGPEFQYLPGKNNILAVCFSRLPLMSKPSEGKATRKDVYQTPPDEKEMQRIEKIMDNPEIMELFLNHPPLEATGNPITMQNVQQHQFNDLELNEMRQLMEDSAIGSASTKGDPLTTRSRIWNVTPANSTINAMEQCGS